MLLTNTPPHVFPSVAKATEAAVAMADEDYIFKVVPNPKGVTAIVAVHDAVDDEFLCYVAY